MERSERREHAAFLDSIGLDFMEHGHYTRASRAFIEAERTLRDGIRTFNAADSLQWGDILSDHARTLQYAFNEASWNDSIWNTMHRAIGIHCALARSKVDSVRRSALLQLAIDHDILEGYQTWHARDPQPSIPMIAVRIKRDSLGMRGAELGRSYVNVGMDYRFRHSWVTNDPKDIDSAVWYFRQALPELEHDWLKDPWRFSEFVVSAHSMLSVYFLEHGQYDQAEEHLEHVFGAWMHRGRQPISTFDPTHVTDEQEFLRHGASQSNTLVGLYNATGEERFRLANERLLRRYESDARERVLTSEAFGHSELAQLSSVLGYRIWTMANDLGTTLDGEAALRVLQLLDERENIRLRKYLALGLILNDVAGKNEIDSIWYWRGQLQQNDPSASDSNRSAAFERTLARIDRFETELSRKVDALAEADTSRAWIRSVIEHIGPGEQVLVVDPDAGAIVSITRSSIHASITRSTTLANLCNAVAKDVLRPGQMDSRAAMRSHELYKQLIAPYVQKGIDQLIIVPLWQMSNVPVEALVAERPDTLLRTWREYLRYVGDDLLVRYEYAPSMLRRDRLTRPMACSLTLLAPEYSATGKGLNSGLLSTRSIEQCVDGFRDALVPIRNYEEVERITAAVDGRTWIGHEATEGNFRTAARGSGVLHIASHGLLSERDPSYSGLVFTDALDSIASLDGRPDGVLHAYEIYGMRIPCEMVTLSACQTGAGKRQLGEGTLSLARAFRYAGARNVVMSLWKVDDLATVEIMGAFYRHLAEGTGKATALNQAKRDFRRAHPDAPPSLWAAFVLLGDDEPIRFASGHSRLLIVLLAMAIGAIMLTSLIKQKTRKGPRPTDP